MFIIFIELMFWSSNFKYIFIKFSEIIIFLYNTSKNIINLNIMFEQWTNIFLIKFLTIKTICQFITCYFILFRLYLFYSFWSLRTSYKKSFDNDLWLFFDKHFLTICIQSTFLDEVLWIINMKLDFSVP